MGRRLLEGGAYFHVDSQRCGVYLEAWRLLDKIQFR